MKAINLVLALIIIPLVFLSCTNSKISEIPYYDKPDFTPVWTDNKDAEDLHVISDFNFTDQDGKSVTKETLKGKIYAANFFFTTCPGICPAMTRNLLKLQNEFFNDDEVKLVSHSVMPQTDSTVSLKRYEKTFNIKNGMWYLVTGKTSEIYRIARRSYFAEEKAGYNSDSTEFLHSEHVLLVDRNGHLRGIYNGTLALDIERMIQDIKVLKRES
jgi:protein SCO1/2